MTLRSVRDSYNLGALPMKPLNLHAFTDSPHRMQHGGAPALAEGPRHAAPVRAALDVDGLQLPGILVTHKRANDFGGVLFPTLRAH